MYLLHLKKKVYAGKLSVFLFLFSPVITFLSFLYLSWYERVNTCRHTARIICNKEIQKEVHSFGLLIVIEMLVRLLFVSDYVFFIHESLPFI